MGQRMKHELFGGLFLLLIAGGCASSTPKLPYPAFVQTDALEDIFMASLPGTRAKQLAGDPQTRRTSNRIDLPLDWSGTSGAAPGRSTEIFVLAGELSIADIVLTRGGYAYLPAGSLGFNIAAPEGARILWFVGDVDPDALIQSPMIIESGLLSWEDGPHAGVSSKILRADPGNGSKTWLVKYAAGASRPWGTSTALREGYLVAGDFQDTECINGKAETGVYAPNGYFYRPANTISGGGDSLAVTDSVWLFRETTAGQTAIWPGCVVVPQQELAEPQVPETDSIFD